jgi:hypothetical protein
MNDHQQSVKMHARATTADQRASLIEDIATLVVQQHRRQQRDAVRVDDRQQQASSEQAKERTETRHNK